MRFRNGKLNQSEQEAKSISERSLNRWLNMSVWEKRGKVVKAG